MVNTITNDNKQTTPQATLKLPNKQKWQLQNTMDISGLGQTYNCGGAKPQ
jgi:hypothetical protein